MEDLKEEIKFILKCMMVSCSLAKTDNENKCIIDNYTYDLVKLFNKHNVNARFDSKLRDKFFKECVSSRTVKSTGIVTDYHQWINIAPHDLFEWFKVNVR